MFPGIEIPQRPEPKEKDTKEFLGGAMQWIKNLFTSEGKTEKDESSLKKFSKTLYGAALGILSLFSDKPKPQTEALADLRQDVSVAQTQDQLEQLQSSIQPLFDHTQIESEPYKTSDRTGVTLCSGTALLNLRKMGAFKDKDFFSAKLAVEKLTKNPDMVFTGIPSGDAIDVRNFYIMSNHIQKIPGSTTNEAIPGKLDASGKNLADILVDSTSPWEHRAVAFKSVKDGHWYILDPYRAGQSTKPLPLEQYKAKIMFAIPLSTQSIKAPLVA